MQKTIYVMPNPYCALDAQGRLAGGCQMAEERAGVAAPSNLKVGAELRVVEGSYNDRQAEISAAVDSGKMSSPVIPAVYSRDEKYWFFSAVEPVSIPVSAKTEGFYVSRSRSNGTPLCVFLCSGPEDLPLEQLAEARLDAIAGYEAAYIGKKAPVDDWKSQFELDEVVAEVMEAVDAKRKAAAAEAEQKAAAAVADAEQAASNAKAKRDEARKAAVEKAKQDLAIPDLVPGDDKPKKAPASNGPARVEVRAPADGSVNALSAEGDAAKPAKNPSRSEK